MLRTSEIASIDRGSVDFRPGCVYFAFSKPTKTQHQGPLKSFAIKSLDDPSIDPVKTLREYYRFTEQFRNEGNSKLLLIGLSKPHKLVGRSTVGHWIKNLLKDAGVDASFSAHSTRSAAASKAARAGLPNNSILLAASWREESTFTKFYRRDVIQPSVADAILSQDSTKITAVVEEAVEMLQEAEEAVPTRGPRRSSRLQSDRNSNKKKI